MTDRATTDAELLAMMSEIAPSDPLESLRERFPTVGGGSWSLDELEVTPAVWGRGKEVLWAEGEPLWIVGPTGVGKTTLAGQLVLARLGLRNDDVLGLPVTPTDGRLLYLALDRPRQAARAFRRGIREGDRDHLDQRMVVIRTPMMGEVINDWKILRDLALANGCTTIMVDSVKDLASKLSDEETGSLINTATQAAIASGIEVLMLHHQRKGQQGQPKRPTTVDDVYGSSQMTNGAGSILALWAAESGSPVVEALHLKQPAELVGPLRLLHDQDAGHLSVESEPDPLAVVLAAGQAGVTVKQVAVAMYGGNERAHVERARRQLRRLHEAGMISEIPGVRGGPDGGTETRWKLPDLLDGQGGQ